MKRKYIISSVLVLFTVGSFSCAVLDNSGGPPSMHLPSIQQQEAVNARIQQRVEQQQRDREQREDEIAAEPERALAKEEDALQKQYVTEYDNNKDFQYIKNANNYDEILNNIQNLTKDSPLKAKATITKNNIALAAVLYGDLTTLSEIFNNLINSAVSFKNNRPTIRPITTKQNNCVNEMLAKTINDMTLSPSEHQRLYNEAMKKCYSSPDITTTEIYHKITAERDRIESIRSEIYNYSSSYEKNLFQKSTGYVIFRLNDNTSDDTLAGLLIFSNLSPEPRVLYSLNGMHAMQTLNNGILMAPSNLIAMNKVTFLYTNKDFVDGQSLDGYYAYKVGTYKYQSLSGARNVYAFKIFHYNIDQIVKEKHYYFYPNVIDVHGIKERILANVGISQ